MFLRIISVLLLLMSALSAASAPAKSEMRVVASIRPVHSLVSAIMLGAGAPELIVEGAGSPHHYVLKPSAARRLHNASHIFWIGPQLETFLQNPLAKLANGAVITELGDDPALHLLPVDPHAEENDHGEHMDMHIWLDPENARLMAARIGAVLAKADPHNAALYLRNVKSLQARLSILINDLNTEFSPVREIAFSVYHDSFRYLEKRFQLKSVATGISGVGNAPSAGKIAKIRDAMRKNGVKCLFSEPQFSPKIMAVIAEESDVRLGVLDPLGSQLMPGSELYFELMRNNSRAIIECMKDDN